MKKFTFILEFRGGTYISQVYGNDLDQAKVAWLKDLSISKVKYLGKKSLEELSSIVMDDRFILLRGMDNVWCSSGSLKAGFYLVNVIL
jgi:hypothetical protein